MLRTTPNNAVKKSHNLWLNAWYGGAKWVYCLLPLSWLFCVISVIRKYFILRFSQKIINVPVIIVGNISLGGTGKTPLLIALVEYLQQQGYKPGVVSRGYGGKAPQYPYEVDEATTAFQSGDEPLLIFNATKCNVCVAPDRVAAAQLLVKRGCNIILSDDGLQHYRLGRDLEIAVVDGLRLFGNRHCLPVGPLREPIARLRQVDLLVVNDPQQDQPVTGNVSYPMQIVARSWKHLRSHRLIALADLPCKKAFYAIAGIGNPQRFFNTLAALSLGFESREFSDHHQFSLSDFHFVGDSQLVMTEKDAVKCNDFAQEKWYSLMVGAKLPTEFWQAFQQKLDAVQTLKKYKV